MLLCLWLTKGKAVISLFLGAAAPCLLFQKILVYHSSSTKYYTERITCEVWLCDNLKEVFPYTSTKLTNSPVKLMQLICFKATSSDLVLFPMNHSQKYLRNPGGSKHSNWIIQYYKPTPNPTEIVKSLLLVAAPLCCKCKIQIHVIFCYNIWLPSPISLASLSFCFFKEILTVQMLQQFTSMTSRDSCYTSSRWEGYRNTELFFLGLYHRILCSLKTNVKCHRIWLMSL